MHAWEHQAFIAEGAGVLWVEGTEYQFRNTGAAPMCRVTVNPLRSVR